MQAMLFYFSPSDSIDTWLPIAKQQTPRHGDTLNGNRTRSDTPTATVVNLRYVREGASAAALRTVSD